MARRSTTKETTTTEETKPNYADIEDPFERARAQFGVSLQSGDVRLVILRYKSLGEPEYLAAMDYSEETHTPDWIRESYGSGKYVLRFLDRKTREQWSKTFPIAELPDENPRTQASGGDAELLRLLREQNEKLLSGVIRGGMQPVAPAGGATDAVVEMLRQQAELNRTLLTALLNKPDMTTTLISGAEKIFSAVQDMKSESSGDWVSTLPRIAKEIAPVLQGLNAQAAAQRPPLASSGAPPDSLPAANPLTPRPVAIPGGAPGFTRTGPGNGPTPAPPASSDIVEEEIKVADLISVYAPQFLEAAKNNIHAGGMANAVLDSIPAMYHPTVGRIEVDDIIAKEPGLVGFRSWVSELVSYVRAGGWDDEAEKDESAS